MKIIYLIGGICDGKSTVASMLEELGAHYIDLDKLAKNVMGYDCVKTSLDDLDEGDFVEDGEIVGDNLAEYVFSSRENLHRIDRALFPLIKAELDNAVKGIDDDGKPVLIEYSGYYGEPRKDDVFLKDADSVVWVTSKLTDKLARAKKRKIRPVDLTWVMRVQPFNEEYEAVADYVIQNDCSLRKLEGRCEKVWDSCCQ
jgi:dephospho-CoA kinase